MLDATLCSTRGIATIRQELARRVSLEEQELASKRGELAQLQAQLADRELFLTNLRVELSPFEGLYFRQVGILYAVRWQSESIQTSRQMKPTATSANS